MSAKRPSLKGKGAQIFLGDEPTEEHASRKNVQEVAEKLQTRKTPKPKARKTAVSEVESNAVAAPETAPVPAAAVENEKIEKEKATFYLPVDVLEDLENVWHDVRRLTHRKIKKSEIVSIALQNAADEFKAWQNEERKRSRLMDRLSD